VATPERLSEQANVTVTGVVFQPFEPGTGDTAAVIVGGVLSTLTFAQALTEAPELSTAWPQIGCFAPSVLTTIGAVQVEIGYEPGVQLKLTVGSELNQPFAFGAGDTAAAMDGGTG
jgi:hypothetical protein